MLLPMPLSPEEHRRPWADAASEAIDLLHAHEGADELARSARVVRGTARGVTDAADSAAVLQRRGRSTRAGVSEFEEGLE
jgi:hypothetical protein